jgi:hypothetical protein
MTDGTQDALVRGGIYRLAPGGRGVRRSTTRMPRELLRERFDDLIKNIGLVRYAFQVWIFLATVIRN